MPERDSRWEIIVGLENWEDFQELGNSFELNSYVYDEICKMFELTQKLITYSYYEYEFLDAAFSRAINCFEFALKNRLSDLIDDDLSEKELGNLIDLAASRSLFDIDKDRVHSLRKIRNDFMHTDRNQMYGSLSLNGITEIVELINGLFEDVEIRIERKRKIRSTNKKLTDLFEFGANLKSARSNHYIFDIELLYYNNKKNPKIYTFCFYPIFPIPDTSKTFQIGEPIIVETNQFKVNNKLIIENDSQQFIISQLDESEEKIITEWKNNINENFPMIRQAIDMRKTDFLNRAKSERS